MDRLPLLESLVDIVNTRTDEDFGKPRLRMQQDNLRARTPGFYCDRDILHDDDYDWVDIEDAPMGRLIKYRVSSMQDMHDEQALPFLSGSSIRNKATPSTPGPIFNVPPSYGFTERRDTFEKRRRDILGSIRVLKTANAKLNNPRLKTQTSVMELLRKEELKAKLNTKDSKKRHGSGRRGKKLKASESSKAESSDIAKKQTSREVLSKQQEYEQFFDVVAARAAELGSVLPSDCQQYNRTLTKRPLSEGTMRIGLDRVPILSPPHIYWSEEVEKAFLVRQYGPDSVMTIRPDSAFPASNERDIHINHMEHIVYKSDRQYGATYDLINKSKRELRERKLAKRLSQASKGNSSLHSTLSSGAHASDGFINGHTEVTSTHSQSHSAGHSHTLSYSFSGPVHEYGKKVSPSKNHVSFAVDGSPLNNLSEIDGEETAAEEVKAADAEVNESVQLALEKVREMSLKSGDSFSALSQRPLSARNRSKDIVFNPHERLHLPSIRSSFISDSSGGEREGEAIDNAVKVPTSPKAAQGVDSQNTSSHFKSGQSLHSEASKSSLAPVAFGYNAEGRIETIHRLSKMKPRPSSADKVYAAKYKEVMEREELDRFARLSMARRGKKSTKDLSHLVKISPKDSEEQRNALIWLYERCGGESWVRADNWLSDKPVSEWFGIFTTVEGYVFEIHLPRNNLSGHFPDSIGILKKLELINFDENDLYGELPEYALQKCRRLTVLSARKNSLHGEIPFDLIRDLKFLQEVWLSSNHFEGDIQQGLCLLKGLTHVCLDNNHLTGPIPTEISKLMNLRYLSLGRNQLTGHIPSSIIALNKLEVLSIYSNKFSGTIPDWMQSMPSLLQLITFDNLFETSDQAAST